MRSIMKKYRNEEDRKNSKIFSKLYVNDVKEFLNNHREYSSSLHKQVSDFLGEYLAPESFIILISPWMHTQQILSKIHGIKTSNDKKAYTDRVNKSLDNTIKLLLQFLETSMAPSIHALTNTEEPNIPQIEDVFNQIKKYMINCTTDISFESGGIYCEHKILRYGVLATLDLGLINGLHHGRDSQLYDFVEIVTKLERCKIMEIYNTYYKSTDFDEEIKNNKILQYIYDRNNITKNVYEGYYTTLVNTLLSDLKT